MVDARERAEAGVGSSTNRTESHQCVGTLALSESSNEADHHRLVREPMRTTERKEARRIRPFKYVLGSISSTQGQRCPMPSLLVSVFDASL